MLYKLNQTKGSSSFVIFDASAVPGFTIDALKNLGIKISATSTLSQKDGIDLVLKPLQDLGILKYSFKKHDRKVKGGMFANSIQKLGDEAVKLTIFADHVKIIEWATQMVLSMDNAALIDTSAPKANLLTANAGK